MGGNRDGARQGLATMVVEIGNRIVEELGNAVKVKLAADNIRNGRQGNLEAAL